MRGTNWNEFDPGNQVFNKVINFRLKEINAIEPFGQKPDLSLHWFALTDGELWLDFAETTLYEYTKEALTNFSDKQSRYNDYQIARFIEDYSELFQAIGESLPSEIYELTLDLSSFLIDTERWLRKNEVNDDETADFFDDSYYPLTSWTEDRKLDSGHLLGGPDIYFFRHSDKIRIVWKSDAQLEDGADLWTASNGQYEMEYGHFVQEVENFGLRFFNSMMEQVKQAIDKEWGEIQLDKNRLVEEHREREEGFREKMEFLEIKSNHSTKWDEVQFLYKDMRKDISK